MQFTSQTQIKIYDNIDQDFPKQIVVPNVEKYNCHDDANQANKEMTKDAHYEKSSQQSSEDLTKDLADLTRGRNGHKPKHLMFFLLIFLKNKTSCK